MTALREPGKQPQRLRGSWPAAPAPVVPIDQLPPQPSPNRVKVLHVITRFFAGAGGNTLLSAEGMDPERYDVWVAGAPSGPLWARAEEAGLRTVKLPHMRERISPVDDLRVLVELVRLMRRERFSVVHTHCSKAGMLGRLAARLAGVPVVVHTFHLFAAHEGLSRLRNLAYLAMDRAARRLAHSYLAVSPRVAREAVEQRLAPAGRVEVVPSAVELEDIDPLARSSVRAELGLPADAPVVGMMGRIVAQKAPLDFVRMAAEVRRRRPDAVFVMVGDASNESAPLEKEVHAEARRLGVPVLFTGFRADAPKVVAAFDVYVVCSRYEGLGRALTEAMAAARPVVATAVNGVPDLVEPGSTGLLVGPGDVAALADCVTWLIDHPTEAARMGAQGRARVLGSFDTETMCDQLDEVYCSLLGQPPRTAVAEQGRAIDLAGLVPTTRSEPTARRAPRLRTGS